MMRSLKNIILKALPNTYERNGWYCLKCLLPDCQDYKVRAGFSFTNSSVFYNCFNCGTKASQSYSEPINKKMFLILKVIGISHEIISSYSNGVFFRTGGVTEDLGHNLTPNIKDDCRQQNKVNLPPNSIPLSKAPLNCEHAKRSRAYLRSRGLCEGGYDYYISSHVKYYNRIILPVEKNGNLIYWQARSLGETKGQRYLNPPIARKDIFYGQQLLDDETVRRIFWCEGLFDAISVSGGCIFGSTLFSSVIHALNETSQEHIFVIDADKSGLNLGKQAVRNGFSITHLDSLEMDSNFSMLHHGKIWTVYSLIRNIKRGFAAKIYLKHLESILSPSGHFLQKASR